MEEEIWKDVKGYEGLYQVSNAGRVKSIDRLVSQQGRARLYRGTIMAQYKNKNGYCAIRLSRNNNKKGFLVHRLVAEAFIQNHMNLPFVNHKDEKQSNNNVENLEWCTPTYNVNYGTSTLRRSIKMGESVDQYSLDGELIGNYYSLKQAEKITGVPHSIINSCCKGKQSSAGGFVWKYAANNSASEQSFVPHKNAKRIVTQYDLELNKIAVYDSAREAERKTGIAHNNISACCRGVTRQSGGFMWRYGNDAVVPYNCTAKNQKQIIQLSLDESVIIGEYSSIAEAAKKLGGGTRDAGIKQCLYGKNKTAYGFKWEYA